MSFFLLPGPFAVLLVLFFNSNEKKTVMYVLHVLKNETRNASGEVWYPNISTFKNRSYHILDSVQVHGRDDFRRSFGQSNEPLTVVLHVVDDDDRHRRVHDHVFVPVQTVSRHIVGQAEQELGHHVHGRPGTVKHICRHYRIGRFCPFFVIQPWYVDMFVLYRYVLFAVTEFAKIVVIILLC